MVNSVYVNYRLVRGGNLGTGTVPILTVPML